MSDSVSFIIPNRGGKDLDKVIQNINDVYSDVSKEIIVVEQCDERPFMRGQLFNIGVKYATGKYLALTDNDIYHLRKVPWIEIYETIKKPLIGFKYISQVTLKDGTPIITSTANCEVGFGGFNFLSKEDFINANGFSNLMIGWGAEDNEFFYRFKDYVRIPQNLGHLTHPRRVNTNPRNTELNRDIWYNHRTNKNDDGFNETTFNLISSSRNENVLYLKVDKISVIEGFKFKELLGRHFG